MFGYRKFPRVSLVPSSPFMWMENSAVLWADLRASAFRGLIRMGRYITAVPADKHL